MDHTENSTKPMEAYAEEGISANTEETASAAAEEGFSANTEETASAAAEEGISANTEETVSAAAEEGISANTEETVSEAAQEEEYVSDDTLAAAMEAILFAMGDAVSLDLLAQALRISPERTETIAGLLAARCAGPASGLVLNRYEDAIQLSTKPELLEYLIRIASQPKKPRLTPTLMETLSIIAFKQPVTRMEVENIRGVNSDFAINRLVSFDLVEEVGRKEVPGRPLLFGTTQQFLRSFGLSSVDQLPEPEASRMEEFREEAEEEVSTGLNV